MHTGFASLRYSITNLASSVPNSAARDKAHAKSEVQRFNTKLIAAVLLIFLVNKAFAGTKIPDAELNKAITDLSAATLVAGEGWTVYEQLLHPEYSRWAVAEIYEGREKSARSLEEWWNFGMRVAERDIDIVAVDMIGNVAIIRFRASESLVRPGGRFLGLRVQHLDWRRR